MVAAATLSWSQWMFFLLSGSTRTSSESDRNQFWRHALLRAILIMIPVWSYQPPLHLKKKCLEHGVCSCTWMRNTDAQMHKSAPTHVLIESSPFLFHVVLCGPHSGLWNCFICDFCALASQQLLPWKSCAFQSTDILVDFTTTLFFFFLLSRLILHASNVRPFSILTAIILHISILPPSLSILTLSPPTLCLFRHYPSVC